MVLVSEYGWILHEPTGPKCDLTQWSLFVALFLLVKLSLFFKKNVDDCSLPYKMVSSIHYSKFRILIALYDFV